MEQYGTEGSDSFFFIFLVPFFPSISPFLALFIYIKEKVKKERVNTARTLTKTMFVSQDQIPSVFFSSSFCFSGSIRLDFPSGLKYSI